MWTVLFIVSTLAFGAWFARAAMTDHWSTLTLSAFALLSLFAAFSQAGETRKLLDQAHREEAEEWRKVFRPRL